MSQFSIPAVWMRGGTSKGLFFHSKDLPVDDLLRDEYLLRIMGSPDSFGRQSDGVGGGTVNTSNVAIISPSKKQGQQHHCQVDFLFGQIPVDGDIVDYSGGCGDLLAAVACFAIEEGLLHAFDTADYCDVRIWQINTEKVIHVRVPCSRGKPLIGGTYLMPGVSEPGARIGVSFIQPDGRAGVLPCGEPVTSLDIPELGVIEASIIDAGHPTVFVRAKDFGLTGTELPRELDSRVKLLENLERIRAYAAVNMGLADSIEVAHLQQPARTSIAIISASQSYQSTSGHLVAERDTHLLSRIFSLDHCHHTYTGTGAAALAVAAHIPDSLVEAVLQQPLDDSFSNILLGHPAGVMDLQASVCNEDGLWFADAVTMGRTARRLMSGQVYLPE